MDTECHVPREGTLPAPSPRPQQPRHAHWALPSPARPVRVQPPASPTALCHRQGPRPRPPREGVHPAHTHAHATPPAQAPLRDPPQEQLPVWPAWATREESAPSFSTDTQHSSRGGEGGLRGREREGGRSSLAQASALWGGALGTPPAPTQHLHLYRCMGGGCKGSTRWHPRWQLSAQCPGVERPHRPQTPGARDQPLTLVTVLPPEAGWTLLPTRAADGVTGRARGTGTRLLAPRPEEAGFTL